MKDRHDAEEDDDGQTDDADLVLNEHSPVSSEAAPEEQQANAPKRLLDYVTLRRGGAH
jgi:hypothetical protein